MPKRSGKSHACYARFDSPCRASAGTARTARPTKKSAMFEPNEPYSLKSDTDAILLIVESQELTAHARAVSTPQRIKGATWPSDILWMHAAKK